MKYRNKPVIIDAIQWRGDNYPEVFEFTEGNAYPTKPHSDTLIVETPGGELRTPKGSYIIRCANGEYCPCQEDFFNKIYEQVK